MISIATPATIEISSGLFACFYATQLSMTILDWASFELISAGATIEKDPHFLYPSDTEFSTTGLFFSQEQRVVPKRVVLK